MGDMRCFLVLKLIYEEELISYLHAVNSSLYHICTLTLSFVSLKPYIFHRLRNVGVILGSTPHGTSR